jgi:hypothetical protein
MRRALVIGALVLGAGCQSALQLPGAKYGCDAGVLPADFTAQCPSSWRCGLEGVCHPTDGGPHQCTDDSWCDDGWKCTFQGVCAAASEDVIAPSSNPALTASPRSPGLTASGISQVEGSFPFEAAVPGGVAEIITTVTLGRTDGTFVEINQYQSGFTGLVGAITGYTVTPLPWSGPIEHLVTTPGATWRLNGGRLEGAVPRLTGGLDLYSPDGGPTTATGLIGAPGLLPLVAAYDDATLWPFYVVPAQMGPPNVVPAFPGPGPMPPPPPAFVSPPVSLTAAVVPACMKDDVPAPSFLSVAADGALSALVPTPFPPPFFATYAIPPGGDAGWHQVILNESDGGLLRASRVRVRGNILAVEPPKDSGHDLVLFELTSCDRLLHADLVPGFDSCSVCGDDKLVDFWPEADVAGGLTAYCGTADGGYGAFKRLTVGPVGQACGKVLTNPSTPTSFFDETSTVNGSGAPGVAAFWGSHGNLWLGEGLYGLLPFYVPDLPGIAINGALGDGTPTADGGEPFFLSFSRDGTYASNLFDGGLAIFAQGATGDLGMACEVVGPLRTLMLRSGLVSVHTGSPGDMSPSSSTVIASRPDPSQVFDPPYNAVTFTAGSQLGLAVTANGQILGADITENVAALGTGVMPAPMPAPLVQKVVLPNGESIVSLLVVPGSDVSLYALASGALFHITGKLDEGWTATQIAIPPGNAKRLLTTNAHIRIAYDDGRVFSLTTSLALAPAADGGMGDVGDFAMYCGDTYALAAGGLYRLDAVPGAVTGTWTRAFDATAMGLGGAGSAGLDKGTLRVSEDPRELQIMSGYGSLVVIRASSGCAP